MRDSAPESAQELYARLPETLATILGCASHIDAVVQDDAMASLLPTLAARFSPASARVFAQPAMTASFDQLLTVKKTLKSKPQQSKDEWTLKVFKTNLTLLVGRVAQGMGDRDPAVAQLEWDSLARYPHVHGLTFGVCELVAELFTDEVITESGLALAHPGLLETTSMQQRYVAQTTFLTGVLEDIARGRGTTLKAELKVLVRSGAGQLALWRLVDRWGGHAEFGNSEKLHKLGPVVDMRRALEKVMSDFNSDWTNVAA